MEYYNRFVRRGNTKEFIDVRINNFDTRIEQLKNQKHPLIILKSNEYLEDYLKKENIIG